MTRLSALVLVACTLTACGDGSARQAGARGSTGGDPAAAAAPSPPPPSADPNDPAEPAIPDLARLARYVFRTMQQHEQACPVANPYRDSLHFAFAIEVVGGRMTRVALAEVAFEGPAGRRALPPVMWPRELAEYAACLEPPLRAVTMRPAPADGAYQPFYSFAGRPDGIAAP